MGDVNILSRGGHNVAHLGKASFKEEICSRRSQLVLDRNRNAFGISIFIVCVLLLCKGADTTHARAAARWDK